MSNLKELSKKNYDTLPAGSIPCIDEIKTGAIQRIADATEKMSVHVISIMNDRDRFKSWYEEKEKENQKLRRQLAASKGQITRLKNRIN